MGSKTYVKAILMSGKDVLDCVGLKKTGENSVTRDGKEQKGINKNKKRIKKQHEIAVKSKK